jgi:uncharacterized LabA/DUF88 family protein
MNVAQQRLPRFAVLIDADNTSPQIAAGLFEEISKFGEASVRRIYGDFSSSQLRSWADILQKHAIDPYQQFAYTKGKNASDIALVIDAMDLLHSERFDGFCLVSSDSDFTRLASRLREQGADVYGFGTRKTPESFRQACRRFIYTENLMPERPVAATEQPPVAAASKSPTAAIPILERVIAQLGSEEGWVNLDRLGEQLPNFVSDFDTRTYGFRKLSDLVRKAETFEVEKTDAGRLRVRVRPTATQPKPSASTATVPDLEVQKTKRRKKTSKRSAKAGDTNGDVASKK